MSQNLISLSLSDEQLSAAAAALWALETAFDDLISLDADERRGLLRMGPKSEVFCRQTLSVLAHNPQLIPASLKVSEAQADLLALDRLRPLLDRLQRLAERGKDTEAVLGSDIMDVALEGYGMLKAAGSNEGLDGLRKDLSSRFAKTRRAPAPAEA
ncbi:MAG: hypothetical protein ACREPE_06270 [Lysobacter sp.]